MSQRYGWDRLYRVRNAPLGNDKGRQLRTRVRIGIGCRNHHLREAMKAALRSDGFTSIEAADSPLGLVHQISGLGYDLLICDASHLTENVLHVFKGIRHGELGRDPFPVIIGLVDCLEEGIVRAVIDAGVDDLLAAPLATGFLRTRVTNLCQNRKHFVVTTDYIGPDRRKAARQDGFQPGIIDAPNPLASKLAGEGDNVYYSRVADAVAGINRFKIERHAAEMAGLLEEIRQAYRSGGGDVITRSIGRIIHGCKQIEARLPGDSFAHITNLCRQMHDIASRIKADPVNADRVDLALLPEVGMAIHKTFFPDEADVESKARSISQSLTTSRGEAPPGWHMPTAQPGDVA